MNAPLPSSHAEMDDVVTSSILWLQLGIEIISVLFVTAGVIVALVQFARAGFKLDRAEFVATRLTLARFLSIALEFQLGADILGTAVAPSWPQLGKLAVVAAIRTGLNYFLTKEMKDEHALRRKEERTPQK